MTRAALQFAGCSDTGQVRDHNEDRIAQRPDLGVAVLADGMGGHRAGEVASEMAVHSVLDELEQALREAPLAGSLDDDGTEAVYLCMNAIAQANTAVYQSAQQHPERAGMGTTLVLALFAPDSVTIAHVGDSRVYLLRDGQIQRLTNDHSLIEESVRDGLCTLEEARKKFSKNVITRALGVGPDVEAEVRQLNIHSGDVFLLCSDGLSDLVSDEDLRLTVQDFGANLDSAATRLVQVANARGGVDNISVVLVHCI